MGMVKKESFAPQKNILKFNHVVSKAYLVKSEGVTADSDGHKIVKAGTILPANDATAEGVLLNDVDVTYGDTPGALVIHGFIDKDEIPEQPADTVNLPLVIFM